MNDIKNIVHISEGKISRIEKRTFDINSFRINFMFYKGTSE